MSLVDDYVIVTYRCLIVRRKKLNCPFRTFWNISKILSEQRLENILETQKKKNFRLRMHIIL
jgi:hypothetical protein